MAIDPPDPGDPLVARLVEQSLAKYEHLLPPEALAELRLILEGFALTHPEMRTMVDRLRPRASTDASGDRVKDPEAAVGAATDDGIEGRKVG